MRSVRTSVVLLGSLLPLLTLLPGAADAAASEREEPPARGSWRKLSVRAFDVPDDADFDATLNDLPRLLRNFHPAGMKVTDVTVEPVGPRKLPRVTFKATTHVDVEIGPVHIQKDEEVWVRADVTARAGRCAYDATRLGYEVKLDLTASDEPVSANVQTMVAALCVDSAGDAKAADGEGTQSDDTHRAQRHVELTSFMQVGPDYGTRVAGRLATNMLIKQTDPIVAAVRASLLRGPPTPRTTTPPRQLLTRR